VSPVRYERGFYILEDGILHSYRRETLKSYIVNVHIHIVLISAIFSVQQSARPPVPVGQKAGLSGRHGDASICYPTGTRIPTPPTTSP
jgi:hypothetical protein